MLDQRTQTVFRIRQAAYSAEMFYSKIHGWTTFLITRPKILQILPQLLSELRFEFFRQAEVFWFGEEESTLANGADCGCSRCLRRESENSVPKHQRRRCVRFLCRKLGRRYSAIRYD